jgi:hypothetical protein
MKISVKYIPSIYVVNEWVVFGDTGYTYNLEWVDIDD